MKQFEKYKKANNVIKLKDLKENRTYVGDEIKDERISFFINRILEYEDIVSNSWVPIPWIILYKKVPEGLEVTIDTDEYFDDSKAGSFYHFYDFVKDIFQDYENEDLYSITGFRDEDVEFLNGEKNGHATYLLHTSPTLKESSYKNRKSW